MEYRQKDVKNDSSHIIAPRLVTLMQGKVATVNSSLNPLDIFLLVNGSQRLVPLFWPESLNIRTLFAGKRFRLFE
jgi:hypothetical protein